MLRISWREHGTNASILEELQPKRRFPTEVESRKLKYFGHIARAHSLTQLHPEWTYQRQETRGRPQRLWTEDIKEWTYQSVAD